MRLGVPFLADDEVAEFADSFLTKYEVAVTPVEIEWIVEKHCRMDIVPLPGILDAIDTDSFISSNMRRIYVDEYVYHKRENRYRFSLAHEVGHSIMHQQYLSPLELSCKEDWLKLILELDEGDRSRMEYQADAFAGRVLVPSSDLKNAFDDCWGGMQGTFREVQSKSKSRASFENMVISLAADKMAPVFRVSPGVMSHRLRDDGTVAALPYKEPNKDK